MSDKKLGKRMGKRKEERGRRRICPACGVKYYDMNRKPVTCPRPDCAAPCRKEPVTRRQKAAIAEKITQKEIDTEIDMESEITEIPDDNTGENQDSKTISFPDADDSTEGLLPEEEDESTDLSNVTGTIRTPKTPDE